MVSHVSTFTFQGIEVTEVDVQVQISAGLPAFMIVGLPDKAVGESRERVRAAIGAMGLALPAKRITINLAPADLLKEGSHFDLPIAIGLLVGMGVLPEGEIAGYTALGELSLDGRLLPVSGILPAAVGANAMGKGLICPRECGAEAAWAGNPAILAPGSLLELINHFKGTQVLSQPQVRAESATPQVGVDFKDIHGQETAKRALEIAAAGGHNLLMSGPPGAGKSMLAAALPGILPPLAPEEMLETSMVASVAGKLAGGQISRARPFRDPHHSASVPAMVGGGKRALPGEISLAHHGVLFLDELPEFPRAVLEALRQPLESGAVTIARVQSHVTYPADFQLIAAMNPCRCGYLGDPARACGKAPKCAEDYQAKLSGPLLDRIDMHIEVAAVDTLEMIGGAANAEPSAAIAARVAKARALQRERYSGCTPKTTLNSQLEGDALARHAMPDEAGMALLKHAVERFRLSMRSYHRIVRVARTIADLAGSAHVAKPHVAEALSYRHLTKLGNSQMAADNALAAAVGIGA